MFTLPVNENMHTTVVFSGDCQAWKCV